MRREDRGRKTSLQQRGLLIKTGNPAFSYRALGERKVKIRSAVSESHGSKDWNLRAMRYYEGGLRLQHRQASRPSATSFARS